ncbi:MAG: hypothetical protein K2Q22_02965, partial [Cytophagales bacterium]|nr:hypothetical protein [Cytophagales bacterium]
MFKSLFVLFFTFCHLFAYSQQIVDYHTKEKIQIITKEFSVLEDTEGKLDISEVLQSSNFVHSDKNIVNLGVSKSTFWIKFTVKNISAAQKLRLNVRQPLLTSIQVYFVSKSRELLYSEKIENSTFNSRPYKFVNYFFDFEFPQNESIDCFIRVTGSSQMVIPIEIGEPEAIVTSIVTSEMLFGFYGGFLLAM